jgi:carboxypeptidase C (cathepsin A)
MRLFAVLWISSFAGQAAAVNDYSPEALKDEVHNLPDAPKVSWRIFSGYIDVSAPGEKAGTRQMFYWFVESQRNPVKDPVLLWTNGGPGCSGLGGFLTEQGPFRAGKDGKALEINENTWTKMANMVFIEQPVGVGFSKAETKLDYGDAQAAADNHRFVVGFFKRYANFAKQDFYISSESYGGHYMPTLAKTIKEEGDVPQFRGIFLGNPLTYMMYRDYGQYGTAWGHQLLPAPLWKRYESLSCAVTFPPSSGCDNVTDEMDQILGGFDGYALDYPVCGGVQEAGRHERWILRRAIRRAKAALKGRLGEDLKTESPYEPCSEQYLLEYLNRADVQSAIHVKPGAKWQMCSDKVSGAYNQTDVNANMVPVWKQLIAEGDLNIMILSGDDDSVCATLGTQQFIWDLGYKPLPTMNWKRWTVGGQTAGFLTSFDVPSPNKKGRFSFATVHSAGHMVPATQPERSLSLLNTFLTMGKSGQSDTTVVV